MERRWPFSPKLLMRGKFLLNLAHLDSVFRFRTYFDFSNIYINCSWIKLSLQAPLRCLAQRAFYSQLNLTSANNSNIIQIFSNEKFPAFSNPPYYAMFKILLTVRISSTITEKIYTVLETLNNKIL